MKDWKNEGLLHSSKNMIKDSNNSYQVQKAVFHLFSILLQSSWKAVMMLNLMKNWV